MYIVLYILLPVKCVIVPSVIEWSFGAYLLVSIHDICGRECFNSLHTLLMEVLHDTEGGRERGREGGIEGGGREGGRERGRERREGGREG